MNDGLRLLAVGSQLVGLVLIFLMRTYGISVFWQGCTLVIMLLTALAIAVVRRYQRNQTIKARNRT